MTSSVVRSKISSLIEQWQKICILAERIIKRREAAAVRVPPTTPRRPFMPAHFGLPSFSSHDDVSDNASLASSVFSGLMHPRRALDDQSQADTARLTNALKVVVEVNAKCWRGDECELCSGVRQGVSSLAAHTQEHGDALEHRVSVRCIGRTVGIDVLLLLRPVHYFIPPLRLSRSFLSVFLSRVLC